MAILREIVTQFVFKGDTKKVENAEQSFNDLKNRIKQSDTNIRKLEGSFNSLNPAIKKTAIAIGTFIGVKGLLGISNNLTKIAQDALETESKFNVVFSSMSQQAKQFSDNLVKSYGLGRNESQKLLSDTGDLLTGFGFTQEEALGLSNRVQELAVDLASFTNVEGGTTRASEALTKALLGEREMVKSLGIAILEEDIKREASARGITGTLTRQQKAQITLDLAIRQSANAIGDYARTSDSAANRNKLLTKRTKDLQISIGKILLPIREFIVEGLLKIIEFMPKVGQAIRIVGMGMLALIPIFALLKATAIKTAVVMAAQWIIAFAPLIGMVALITAIATAIGLLIDDIIAYFQGKNSVTAFILEKMKNLGNDLIIVFKFVGQKIWEFISAPFRRLGDFFSKVKGKFKRLFGKDEIEALNEFSRVNLDLNGSSVAPQTTSASNSIVNNTNNAIVRSPNININIPQGSNNQMMIDSISTGIERGLQGSLNQSLRTMTR